MPDEVVYLVADDVGESAETCRRVEEFGLKCVTIRADQTSDATRWEGKLPALITSRGTWFGLKEIELFLQIPIDARRTA